MKMGALQGPATCPLIRAKKLGECSKPVNVPITKADIFRSRFWGYKGVARPRSNTGVLALPLRLPRLFTVNCTYSSSSNGSGSRAENFKEKDEDYINSTVIEAVEVKSGRDGFTIKMRDGKLLKCVHNNAQGGHLPDYAPHPAIVLKMEDGTGLLLPIIVLEMPSVMLMAAIRNMQIARPTMYQVIKEMVEKMGYKVKLVRVTRRVHEAYFAQIYLVKVDNEADCISFDLRPSDAINIAVRCKVPIQVNKHLAYSDGMKIVESPKPILHGPASDGLLFTEMDRLRLLLFHCFGQNSGGGFFGYNRVVLNRLDLCLLRRKAMMNVRTWVLGLMVSHVLKQQSLTCFVTCLMLLVRNGIKMLHNGGTDSLNFELRGTGYDRGEAAMYIVNIIQC